MALLLGGDPVWSRTPPALGPICLGLMGCGLAWRAAARVLGAPAAIGEIWLGAAGASLAFCLALYVGKAASRPGALTFDLRMPAGRGAVPAFTMALILAGAALAPLWPGVATAVWGAGVIGHGALAALLARELAAAPPDGRPATASLLVAFAGQITAPIGGVALGFWGVSAALFASAVLAWAIIAPLALRRLARVAAPPPPMRAATWILLSPPSVAVVAADRLDPGGPLAPLFYVAAVVTLLGLLPVVGWMTAGGWSPGWGAFAFPSTAFAGATLTMAETRLGWAWDAAAALALTLATLLTLWLAWRAAEAWAKGRLAPR